MPLSSDLSHTDGARPSGSATAQPLVTVGFPVYNGGEELSRALGSLLAQDYPALEIVISDNASTDGTQDVCEQLAQTRPNVRYHRNRENIGGIANFVKLLDYAGGKYFVWAAHDDFWTHDYISTLVQLLEAQPDAVLATPFTRHVNDDGTPSKYRNDYPAPGTGRFDNIRVFLRDDACTWIYGVFRTDWLREHAPRLVNYPTWRGDLTWLFEMLLCFPVVGTDRVTIYKKVTDGSYRPRTEQARMTGWQRILRDLTRVCLQHEQGGTRLVALRHAWYYCYRKYIRRGNPLATGVRMVKVLAMWSYFRLKHGPLVEEHAKPAAKEPTAQSNEPSSTTYSRAA